MENRELLVSTKTGFLHPRIIDREKARLVQFYYNRLVKGVTGTKIRTGGDILNVAESHVNRAVAGYSRAPVKDTPEESFITRLKIISRYQLMPEIWKDTPGKVSHEVAHKKKKFDVEDVVDREVLEEDNNKVIESIPTFMIVKLKTEQEFFEYRKKYYLSEFEFNVSSDLMLLETILADEVILRRITNKKLANESIEDKEIDDIQKRYRENLKVLGVSRSQRLLDGTNQKGNISQLSESLDDKLEEVKNLSDEKKRKKVVKRLLTSSTLVSVKDVMNAIEEIEYMRQRSLRPDMESINPIATKNELPALDEIDAILKESESAELI